MHLNCPLVPSQRSRTLSSLLLISICFGGNDVEPILGDDPDDGDATGEDAEAEADADADDASVDLGPSKKTPGSRGKRKHRVGGFFDGAKRPRSLRTPNAKRDDYDADWPVDTKGEEKIDADGNLLGGAPFATRWVLLSLRWE